MASSDNHGVISEEYIPPAYTNRPMTLVYDVKNVITGEDEVLKVELKFN